MLLEPVKGLRYIFEEYLAYCIIYWLTLFLGLKPGVFGNVSNITPNRLLILYSKFIQSRQ